MNDALIRALTAARVYDLEQPRFAGMPIYPTHRPGYFYALHRRHEDTYKPEAHGRRSSASGTLVMMEHSGTHIDAVSHQAIDLKLHGDVPVRSVESPSGFSKHGIETTPPLLARGVLLDVAGWKGVARLEPDTSISGDDLEACSKAQATPLQAGDVLLVRTGFGACWNEESIYLTAAGVHKSGTLWASKHGVAAVGADNMAWDLPSERDPETGDTLFAHVHLLAQRGVPILENLDLERLAKDKIHRFGFIGIPLKLVGATGSPIRPLALA